MAFGDPAVPANELQTGQAAYISVHPEAYAYPVFNTCPPGTLIPIMIVAVLAAIVASQAIITVSSLYSSCSS